MNDRLIQRLRALTGEDGVLPGEPLAKHCSFRTGGPADLLVRVRTEAQLAGVLEILREEDVEVFLLGRGTNILVGDRGLRGAAVTLEGDLAGVSAEGDILRAGGGAALSRAAAEALANGLTGLEFAAGIPGSAGGAVVMNAGAYGGEMRQVVRKVRLLCEDGTFREYTGEEMAFGYRTSRLVKERAVVTEVTFALAPGDPAEILAKMDDLAARRREKQPLEYPSAGSTFKRPEGHFAGKLIEDAGLRGYAVGGAQVSEKHCGFVINRGGATSAEIRQLIEQVQEKVLETSGVGLEREVIYLGEF